VTVPDVDVDVLGELFEGAPRFVERLAAEAGTVESWDELFDRAEQVALWMPQVEQVELLNAHPRIGAAPTSVSAVSYLEQGYDRDPGTAELQERLDVLNDEYESRHGFRFVIFVNGRSREEIAGLMPDHLEQPTDGERERGLHDVVAIARSRLARMREDQDG
jgi:2-oxo-4-hydroxy-4-carboxy--5-ureidoimidazoline (OHCU) decarboxylase